MSTGIEWTDETWNPTTGCDQVSPGCDHCYALTMAKRLKGMGSRDYQNDGDPRTSGPGFAATMHPHRLDTPLRWTRPRRIFVNSMSDLFHEKIDDGYIASVFAVMALAPQHTFQILTKRHGRMRSLLNDDLYDRMVAEMQEGIYDGTGRRLASLGAGDRIAWPLPNVWLGVSAEAQKWSDIRIPALLDTPAAVRFLSCEPLLGPIDIGDYMRGWVEGPPAHDPSCDGSCSRCPIQTQVQAPAVAWVIVGGESGAGARPMHPNWVRELHGQCIRANVPFLFKQWGEHNQWGERVGKHAAGRVLDGYTFDEYPEPVSA